MASQAALDLLAGDAESALFRVFVTVGLAHVDENDVQQTEYKWAADGIDEGDFAGVDHVVGFEAAPYENYRNLATLVLADIHGSWRDQFREAGITGISVVAETRIVIPGASGADAPTLETLFVYRGKTIGMNYGLDEDGEILTLRLGGPFAKIGSRRGAWMSEDSQHRLNEADQCMADVGKARTFRWHRAD